MFLYLDSTCLALEKSLSVNQMNTARRLRPTPRPVSVATSSTWLSVLARSHTGLTRPVADLCIFTRYLYFVSTYFYRSPDSRAVYQTLGVTLTADTDRARVSLEKQIRDIGSNIAERYPHLPLNRRHSGHDVDTAPCRYTPRPVWKLEKRENAI